MRVLKEKLHVHCRCPGCGADVDSMDALCVQCGYNLVTGLRTETRIGENVPGGRGLRRLIVLAAIGILAYALYQVILRFL